MSTDPTATSWPASTVPTSKTEAVPVGEELTIDEAHRQLALALIFGDMGAMSRLRAWLDEREDGGQDR